MTPAQFSDFYEHWRPQMVRYFGWKVQQRQDAEDLTQDLFAVLASDVTGIRAETADRYMWAYARYIALRGRERLTNAPLTFDQRLPDEDAGSPGSAIRSSPEAYLTRLIYRQTSQIVQSEDQAVCDDAALTTQLAELRPRERAVIDATVIGSKTLVEYALEVGVTAERARQIRARGLDRLRVAHWRRGGFADGAGSVRNL